MRSRNCVQVSGYELQWKMLFWR